jgi:hypothetical protein
MKLFTIIILLFTAAAAAKANGGRPSLKADSTKPGSVNVSVGFVSSSVRFRKGTDLKEPVSKNWTAKGWKGEKVNAQILIRTAVDLTGLKLESGPLSDLKGHHIPASNIKASFIGYVITDGLNKDGGGCGIPPNLDSSSVTDVITELGATDVKSGSLQPVWLSVHIPANATAGLYSGKLLVSARGLSLGSLNFKVIVSQRSLPAPRDWKFHLDLWQNPYSIARMYGLAPWSAAHFDKMRPYMKMLADAGQKVITTTIINDPWNGQTYDKYQSMVKWLKKKDGTWAYDYTIFDQWVSFMISCGIDQEISCYSMIPWDLKFAYHDDSSGRDTSLVAAPGTAAYEAHWKPMLIDFARHLKEKGWFSRTMISMDERPLAAMQQTLTLIKKADSNFKISHAGNYHPEIERYIDDYSLASNQVISKTILNSRRDKGLKTTYYTCCTEGMPNTFSFSAPAESSWLAWHAMNKGYDGYLRWAYNCWNKDPLKDSRFGTWSAGDSFLVYPGNSSSIRFERMIEGIQDVEKAGILLEEFSKRGEKDKAAKLQSVLKNFELNELKTKTASEMVGQAESVLNSFN